MAAASTRLLLRPRRASPASPQDHDKPVWNPTDDRRAVATRLLNAAGQGGAASVDGLLEILQDNGDCNTTAGERPVMNSHTLYSWAVSAAAPDGMVAVLHDPAPVDNCTK